MRLRRVLLAAIIALGAMVAALAHQVNLSTARVTLGEDRSLLRRGNGPQVLASLNDLVVGVLLREGHTNHAAARRLYAAFPDHAFNLLTTP